MTASSLRAHLSSLATPERAQSNARFFKTGAGEYGEGDVFIGVDVPTQRKVARAHRGLPLDEVASLLESRVHEERLTALLILVDRYRTGDVTERTACFDFYLDHLPRVDNWDLVDSSAPQIVGTHLLPQGARERRRLLDRLARSSSMWERRVAMVSTQALIRAGESDDALRLAELLLGDGEDLLHKAVGWMLREVGEYVGADVLRGFLTVHAPAMPRTALRYAIEHFPEAERKQWLSVRSERPANRPAVRTSRGR